MSTSWKSIWRPACSPPLMRLTIGSGTTGRVSQRCAMCRYSGTSRPAAAARQAACDTASMAFAPRRAFVGVPSSSIKRPSRTAWSSAARPRTAGPMMSIDIGDGPTDAKTAVSRRVAVAELDSLMRSRRCPGWDRAPADDPVRQFDVRLDGRPAARVEDLRPTTRAIRRSATCRAPSDTDQDRSDALDECLLVSSAGR